MRLPISDFQKGNDFGKKMNELKWMYASINREDFQEWTIRGQKSQRLQGIFDTKPRWMVLGIIYPGKQGSNCTRIKYDKIYVYPSAGKGTELHKAAKLPV